MQMASHPIQGVAAVRSSPSTSAAPTPSLSAPDTSHHLSSAQAHKFVPAPAPDQGMRFMANHHRQHNPHDPKLRPNSSFKSRRSSLLASVLKSKSKDHPRKSSTTPSRISAAPPTKPRASSAASTHHRFQSLPAPSSTISDQQPEAHTRHSSPSADTPTQQQRTKPHFSSLHPPTPSSHNLGHAAEIQPLHFRDSPPMASLPSPTHLTDRSASSCTFSHTKRSNFASVVAHLTSSSMENAIVIPNNLATLQAGSQAPPSTSISSDAVLANSAPAELTYALDTSQETQARLSSSTSDSAIPSAFPANIVHASSSHTNVPPSLVTRTTMSDTPCTAQLFSSSPETLRNAQSSPAPARQSSCQTPATAVSERDASEQRFERPAQGLPLSASVFVPSPQRFSSLGCRTAAPFSLNTDVSDPSALPRGLARDINEELDSPTSAERVGARAERRMSMLDFLAADPDADSACQLAQASLSAEDLPRSMQLATHSGHSITTLVPASTPLLEASRQLRIQAAAVSGKPLQPRKIDLCDHVRIKVEPLVDRLTMFGSMQSSSNYSLAGSVIVEVPKLQVQRLSAAASVLQDGTFGDHPAVHVQDLTVCFTGYSVYVDATGRFNAVKLAEVSQKLLGPQGFSCPVEMVETGEQPTSIEGPTANAASLKYETEFDLSIPGWLPASQRSRFGATFYCVQATGILGGQAILSALSGFDPFGKHGWQGPSSALSKSLESELDDSGTGTNVAQPKDGASSPPSSSLRAKSKNTWLNKTAKQLHLRTSKKSSGPDAEQSGSASISRRGSGSKESDKTSATENDPLFTKTTEVVHSLLPSGQHHITSECLSVLVQRCRDVVPVPVARLARLATSSQMMRADGTNPSLSQSMLALATLQDAPGAASHSETISASDLVGLSRPHLPISASAPVLLSSPESSANAVGSDAQPGLAPSPRIDANSRSFGADARAHARADARADATEHSTAPNAESETIFVMPRVPSAFDAPRDPAKLTAAASTLTSSATLPNLPSSMSRASSLLDSRLGNAASPPRTSSRSASAGRTSAPLRHFVHKPTLHLPPELGVAADPDAGGGLKFSLTLSLPSHVHVAGAKSDILSFGVQIEVGRTEGWDVLRKWGGLRLKDMDLVCLQTERHSSMPSRSFLSAFPIPPLPNQVDAAALPVVTPPRKLPPASAGSHQVAAEKRLRESYDRSLVLGHIKLANQGKAPHPIEHNVERIRTTIVGPPPFVLRKRDQEARKKIAEQAQQQKTKLSISSSNPAQRPSGVSSSPSQGSLGGSGTNTPNGTSQSAGIGSLRAAFAPTAQPNAVSRPSVMQPLPRALTRSNNSSSSSLRQAFSGANGSGAMQPALRPSAAGAASGSGTSPNGTGRSRRPIPFDLGTASETVRRAVPSDGLNEDEQTADASFADAIASSSHPGSQANRAAQRTNSDETMDPDATQTEVLRRVVPEASAARMGVTSSVTTRSRTQPAPAPRRSRFENAISRLSTFASSMLEQPNEASAEVPSQDARSNGANAAQIVGEAPQASLRATYAFAGDDGQGVDLTKGRVRMTINLPLVSSDLDAARKAGSAQLIPDFESPYVRIRHKLKVKLGFGLKTNVASGPDGKDWAQALVMCVPVRFTEAPPREVQEQFGPVRIVGADTQTSTSTAAPASDRNVATASGGGTAQADITSGPGLPAPFAEPLLPAYAQLFREDGSRLADEGEDLPRYPGRMSVVGEIDEDLAPAISSMDSRHEEESGVSAQAANNLSPVDEGFGSESDNISTAAGNETERGFRTELPRYQAASLPRLSSFAAAPTPMDRTTSLPGHRLLARTTASSVFGLRTSPSHPVLLSSNQSQSATSSAFAEKMTDAGGRPRVGSSAFDPLPTRPGMRPRSATTASLVTFSRIQPAEVLDEALVTSALDDEEDGMDGMQPSHTLESLNRHSQRRTGGVDGLTGNDEDDEEEGEEEEEMDEDDVDMMDGDAGSAELDSEMGHGMVQRMRVVSHRQELSGSDVDERVDYEVGTAL